MPSPIRCAVAIGYVDHMTSGLYRRTIESPRRNAPTAQEDQRSGSAIALG